MDDEDFLVTVEDLRYLRQHDTAGFCIPGLKKWAESHGLDFKDFVRNGIKASQLLATGDGLAEMIIARMKEEKRHGNG